MKSIKITNKITNLESKSFKQYLSEISNIQVFTPEQEAQCCYRISIGDKEAVNELVKRNLRFVVSIAKQYESPIAPLEDLINEGNIGLIIAAEKYRNDTGFKFITYAVFWIRKMIFEYLDKNSRIIRLPLNKITNISKVNQLVNSFEQKNCREASAIEIIDDLDEKITEDDIREYEKFSSIKFDSLDDLLGDEDNKTSLYEVISDENINPTDFSLLDSDIKRNINNILNILKPRDRKIMTLLFGLDGSTPLNLKEVGEKFDLTGEMIRQIKEKSLKTLKKAYKE
jgi:RNA polymerase primary sigma factor